MPTSIVSNSGEWSGNLFDFYFLIVNKLTVDLPRPFKLEGITRIDETPVAEAINGGVSDPRNSAIFSMFSLVDMGERAGTGIPSIYYAWEEAFKLKPTLVDKHNPDRTEMFVPRCTATSIKESAVKQPQSAVNEVSPSVNRITFEDRKEQILRILSPNYSLTPTEIGEKLKTSPITVRRYIRELVSEGKIGYTGTFRNRTYHIIKK